MVIYGYATDSQFLVTIDNLPPMPVVFARPGIQECAASDMLQLVGQQLIDDAMHNIGQDGEFTLRIKLSPSDRGAIATLTGMSVVRCY